MYGKIYLEITNACNLACAFCPPTRRAPELMPRERFELLLGRLEGAGDHLYFHVKGEPLLHPELGAFLALAAERGFAVTITTNGTLLAERAAELLGAGNIRKLCVSLHSHAGAPGAEAYWRGIEAFLDLHRITPRFPVSLRLWNLVSGESPPETRRLWELVRARYPAAALEARPAIELGRRVYLNQAERFEWPSLSLPQAEDRGFCRGLGNQFAILVDGTVTPCCLDSEGEIALGNLARAPLAEILASPRARAMRDGFAHRELVEPLCRTCGYRRRFSRPGELGAGRD